MMMEISELFRMKRIIRLKALLDNTAYLVLIKMKMFSTFCKKHVSVVTPVGSGKTVMSIMIAYGI